MNAVVLQLDLAWHDRAANHAKARAMLLRQRPQPGDLVVLPEAFPVGFSMQIDEIADHNGETDAYVRQLSREFRVWVIAGNMIKPDDRGRNLALVASPEGEIVGRYASRVIAFYDGRILADGPTGQVLDDPEVRKYVIGAELHRRA